MSLSQIIKRVANVFAGLVELAVPVAEGVADAFVDFDFALGAGFVQEVVVCHCFVAQDVVLGTSDRCWCQIGVGGCEDG